MTLCFRYTIPHFSLLEEKEIIFTHITSTGGIGQLCLIGVWLGEDQRTNTMNSHVQKRSDYVFKFYQLLHAQ